MRDKAGVHSTAATQRWEHIASQRARQRARSARWDLDIAVFLFAIMILILILLFEQIMLEIVSGIAALGLALVWVGGWRKENKVYKLFYEEELSRLQSANQTLNETIEDRIQKALRERSR